jgi:hypothetical protein
MLMPPLPPKTDDANKAKFYLMRTLALHLCMTRLADVPFLRGDKALVAFVSLQGDSDWEAAKRQLDLEQTKCDDPGASEGQRMWKRRLLQFENAHAETAERVVQDSLKQMEKFEKLVAVRRCAAAPRRAAPRRVTPHNAAPRSFLTTPKFGSFSAAALPLPPLTFPLPAVAPPLPRLFARCPSPPPTTPTRTCKPSACAWAWRR